MKVQDLAIIFIIIIIPISLVISIYTQYQIQTVNTQTLYDGKLTSATYDAIRAFQINTTSSATSELTNSKTRDLEASVSTFRNSIKSMFSLAGYSDDAVDRYVPALVYTLYDGFYIYSPYKNIANEDGTIKDGSGEGQYGLKPYISYSCKYKTSNGNIDVVITYALDNHVSVQGTIGNEYVNKEGYLIDNITVSGDDVKYNGVEIEKENVKQYLPLYDGGSGNSNNIMQCIKLNGTTYYWDQLSNVIRARLNDTTLTIQSSAGQKEYNQWTSGIQNNALAQKYYKDAKEFSDWFKSSGLENLKYSDAIDTDIDSEGTVTEHKIWENNNNTIFDFNNTTNYNKNIENESSNFNEHRLAIIRHKIEVNLAIAIANYNTYSGASDNVFQMPKLSEEEWDSIIHNISLISFLQGLPIGGKIYNGYSIVTNSESKEVVLENNIYILGNNKDGKNQYYKIGDYGLSNEESGTDKVTINAGVYAGGGSSIQSAGRINVEFERGTLISSDGTKRFYYYPLTNNNASYNSVVMQNNVNTYDDIYEYVNGQSNELKQAFYTALGRERASTYTKWADYVPVNTNVSNGGNSNNSGDSGDSGNTSDTPTTFKITFNPNGGNWNGSTQAKSITKSKGNYIQLQPDGGNPQRAGYTFKGWATSQANANNGNIDYGSNASYTVNAPLDLWAVWTANQTGETGESGETGGSGNTGNSGTTEYQKGDINGDGKVDRTDLSLLSSYVRSGGKGLTEEQKKRADINGDGKIDYIDVFALMRLI